MKVTGLVKSRISGWVLALSTRGPFQAMTDTMQISRMDNR